MRLPLLIPFIEIPLHMTVERARTPVKTALDHKVFNKLISCLVATGEPWSTSVDDGVIVLQNGDNDITSTAATRCIVDGIEHLNIRFEDDDIYTNTVPAKDAHAAWAESEGAYGLIYVDSEDSRTPNKRSISCYGIQGDNDGRSCHNTDLMFYETDECSGPYLGHKSVIASSFNSKEVLKVTFWPHHKCAVDYPPDEKNGYSIMVPPKSDSVCQKRRRDYLSWFGRNAGD